MGLERTDSQTYRQPDQSDRMRAAPEQLTESQNSEQFNFQFKKLKPFNPNTFLRMLEKNTRGDAKNEDE
jgi:hypothetical protein